MTLADTINQMIIKVVESLEITSANPTHINTVIQVNELDTPDLESIIQEGGDVGSSKTEGITKSLKKIEDGPVGEISRMSSTQLGNFKNLLNDPSGFIMQTFIRKFSKGIGAVALAVILGEAVKLILAEAIKPGRMLDIRFKRIYRDETLANQQRANQQSIKQGFSSVIVTSMAGQRGSFNQAAQTTNTLDLSRQNGSAFAANYASDPVAFAATGPDMKSAMSLGQKLKFYSSGGIPG